MVIPTAEQSSGKKDLLPWQWNANFNISEKLRPINPGKSNSETQNGGKTLLWSNFLFEKERKDGEGWGLKSVVWNILLNESGFYGRK